MKYVIKCPYCEHTYFVDSTVPKEDFQCDSCGGQNSTDDVIERIEDRIIIEKEVIKTVVKEVKPEKQDSDLQANKSIDLSNDSVDEDSQTTTNTDSDLKFLWGFIQVIIILVFIICMSIQTDDALGTDNSVEAKYQREKEKINVGSLEYNQCRNNLNKLLKALYTKDIEAVYPYFTIEIDEFFDIKDFQTVLEDSEWQEFLGQDIKVTSMEYNNEKSVAREMICFDVVFSNERKKRLSFYRSDSGVMRIMTNFSGVAKNTKVIAPCFQYSDTQPFYLWIDDKKVTLDYEIMEDEEGIQYNVYTIPKLIEGKHNFMVDTLFGQLSTSCMIESNNEEIILDHFRCNGQDKDWFLVVFSDYWYRIREAAMNYADPSEIRQYFDERVNNDEIEELLRQIRTEIGKRGEQEGALINKIRTTEGGLFCPVAYDTFLIEFEIDYTTINPEKPSGTCKCKLGIIITDEGWKVYENYDNRFFTLADAEE